MNTLLMCHFSELHVRDECGTSRLFVSYIFVLRYFLIIFKSISLFHHSNLIIVHCILYADSLLPHTATC
jgi:hypothetical protein